MPTPRGRWGHVKADNDSAQAGLTPSWGVTPAIQSGLAGNHGLASLYGPDGRKDTLQRFFHQQPSTIPLSYLDNRLSTFGYRSLHSKRIEYLFPLTWKFLKIHEE